MLDSGKQVAVSGEGGVKTLLETPAWEANLDLLESPIPQRQDHSQTIYGQAIVFPLLDHFKPWQLTMIINDKTMADHI